MGKADDLSTFIKWESDPLSVRIDLAYGGGELHRELVRKMREGTFGPQQMGGEGITKIVRDTIASELSQFDEAELLTHWKFGDLLGPASYFVYRAVNKAMQGHVSPAALPFHEGQMYFSPDSLLSALYVHFALELPGSDRPRILCARPGCGKHFLQRNRRMKYCDDPCRKLDSYHRKKQPKY